MTQTLRFAGDWSIWLVGPLALILAALAWWLYRREVRRGVSRGLAIVLPMLRAAAVLLIVLMLAGPVLHHRQVIGELGRVLVFIDGSRSMSIQDPHLSAGRKLLIAQQQGWLAPGTLDTALVDIADQLDEARASIVGPAADMKTTTAAFARQVSDAAAALAKLPPRELAAPPPPTGSITREVYRDLQIGPPEELLQRRDVLDKPTVRDQLDRFQTPANFADNYVQRVRGYVVPPVSGAYTFWITSDDDSRLYLSANDDPAAKKLIARVDGYVPVGQWADGAARAKPIALEAGRRYYIEAIQKEGGGEDHLSVGWQLPGGTMQRPIPGESLAPFSGVDVQPHDVAAMHARMQDELVKPAQALAARIANQSSGAAGGSEAAQELASLAAIAARYEQLLSQSFDAYAATLAASDHRAVHAAIARFDGLSRFGRMEAMLLDAERGLLADLRGKHHVELVALGEGEAESLWSDAASATLPQKLDITPEAIHTDLTGGLRRRLQPREGSEGQPALRTAAVLLTDGQHNEGPSPLQVAQLLGTRQIALYTLGVGSAEPPRDLALLKITAPESVAKDDRMRGEIALADHMPPGKPFTLRIEHEGEIVWEQALVTDGKALRKVAFDFAIAKLVEAKLQGQDRDVKVLSLPLAMRAVIAPVEGETRQDNNAAPLHFRAVTQNWRMLLIDGRARWETRYLHNLFDRDQRWQVNLVLAGPAAERSAISRGDGEGMFPKDKQALFAYDLIVFGELPPGLLGAQELAWMDEFARNRGGGVVFIDGQRGHLARYARLPIGPMLPVDWIGTGGVDMMPERLVPRGGGSPPAPLMLAPTPAENAELWRALPPPHWTASVKVTPGAGEVLLEAVAGEQRVPVMVERRYGAGRVIYLGADETWRWRYEVGDA